MTPLLTERERTHGLYKDTAAMAQALKDVMRSGKNWSKLSDTQKESLEQDAVKTARILSGDANFRDHWDDKAGYSNLAADNIKPSMPQIAADINEVLQTEQQQ